ncbi:Retrovirus-related Pol polyprotein LINE-1 [Gossypium australe]|uniref:Retrovirus-related Pol polyprotein LINE-1 n=1 Tax=Gossypium australe TaxID=47621 RepID=A0A5B6U3D0_9ROSI|nr:Retrovirus-related Pol polyprotein LINE-1 [Gossypium australe]
MAPLKVPGSDGFHAHFLQSQWDTLREDMCQWVKGVKQHVIVLIPKNKSLEDFSQFRPISLCSILYKLVMKVIANWFKRKKSCILCAVSGGGNWTTIKLDLEKAYDRVSWDYIHTALIATGIPIYLRRVIMSTITSSSMQILWNRVPTRKFKPVRGICQGCPLSPHLFVLCMEGLGHSIRANMDASKWKPIRLSRTGPVVSHLFFANSLMIFCKAQVEQARMLDSILNQFYANLGYRISARKTNIYFSKVTEGVIHHQISQMFGFQEVQNLGTYLGVPLLHERVRQKLQNCNARKLSMAGRTTWLNQFSYPFLIIPRARGGLGFRHLSDQSTSFLMKIGFSLVSRVMHSGFESFALSMDGKITFLKLLAETNALTYGGLFLRYGLYSRRISFGPFEMALLHAVGKILGFQEFVKSDGSWNLDLLRVWLPEDVIFRITSIPSPHPDSGQDRVIWARSSSGAFSVRVAYWTLREDTWNSRDE